MPQLEFAIVFVEQLLAWCMVSCFDLRQGQGAGKKHPQSDRDEMRTYKIFKHIATSSTLSKFRAYCPHKRNCRTEVISQVPTSTGWATKRRLRCKPLRTKQNARRSRRHLKQELLRWARCLRHSRKVKERTKARSEPGRTPRE